jgi:hypothetical protein
MKAVEHNRQFETPPVYWADEIEILKSAEGLSIAGQRLLPPSSNSKNRDLMSGYVYAISGAQAGDANKAAHLVFANCTSEEALTKFLLRYGPVLAEADSVEVRPPIHERRFSRTELRAEQLWDVLIREQKTLNSAFQLFQQLRSDNPDGDALLSGAKSLVLGTSFWIDAYNRELEVKDSRRWQESPSWMWTAKDHNRARLLTNAMSPIDDKGSLARAKSQAHALLCHVLNAFPVRLTQYGGIPVEMPSEDVSFGVFPVLYFLLRCDYLWSAKVARCALKDCTRWFRVGSHDSPCCSDEHSLKHRQWLYYHQGKGRQMRQRRRKHQKGSKRARKG